ncbi:hypothetical protein KFK09_007545 [Dendrobium nobile]|uniref:Uncharacterized protein n=1 Tax=Dendrobium nobile TaxID=94219 RepID=A0A8T3BUF5_DENNO|nr:hypothetical protein KFK09_007545 [Dendrobium nobile]
MDYWLKTQFYMALLYTATTTILTAQIVYYGHICHRLEADKACKPGKIDELEYKAKESLVGKNSDERGPKMYEYKGSNSLLAGCNIRSSPIPVASSLGRYGSSGRDLYYR